MIIANILVTGSFLVIALVYRFFRPEKANFFYGDEEELPVQQTRIWDAANRAAARFLLIAALIIVIIQVVVWLLAGASAALWTAVGLIVVGSLGSLVATQVYLRKHFSKNGTPREGSET